MTAQFTNLFFTILLAGGAVTYLWRFIGVIAARQLKADSSILMWVRAVAGALVAALCTKLLIDPPGNLAEINIFVRFIGLAAGIAGLYVFKNAVAGLSLAFLTLIILSKAI